MKIQGLIPMISRHNQSTTYPLANSNQTNPYQTNPSYQKADSVSFGTSQLKRTVISGATAAAMQPVYKILGKEVAPEALTAAGIAAICNIFFKEGKREYVPASTSRVTGNIIPGCTIISICNEKGKKIAKVVYDCLGKVENLYEYDEAENMTKKTEFTYDAMDYLKYAIEDDKNWNETCITFYKGAFSCITERVRHQDINSITTFKHYSDGTEEVIIETKD